MARSPLVIRDYACNRALALWLHAKPLEEYFLTLDDRVMGLY
jgi:hypothetical protein